MKKDVKQLKEKLEDVDVQLKDSQIRCNYLAEDNEQLLEQLRHQREELEAEKRANAQVNISDRTFPFHSCSFQLLDQLTLESSNHRFDRTLTRTENVIKSSEIRIQDLDAQVRALQQVCPRRQRTIKDFPLLLLFRKTVNSNKKMKNYENVLSPRTYSNRQHSPIDYHIVVFFFIQWL